MRKPQISFAIRMSVDRERTGRDLLKDRANSHLFLHQLLSNMRFSLLLVLFFALLLVEPAFSKPIFGKIHFKIEDNDD